MKREREVWSVREEKRREGDNARSNWGTEGERIAHLQGIYVGWERGLSSASMGTGAGNLLQTILRDTCEKLLQERVLRIEQYRAVRDTAEVLLGAALNQLDKSVVNSVIQADRRVGSSHYKAKLKDHDILEIRNLAAQGEKRSDIAKKYGVSDKTIWGIQTGKTWKHVGGPKTLSKYRKQNLTDEDRAKIVRLRKAGKSLQEIALEMRRGKSTIMRVCTQAGVSNPRTRSEMCRKGGLARWGIRMT